MSYDIYYSVRENIKTKYEVDTLFFGKQKVYDYRNIEEGRIFDTYDEAFNFMAKHHLSTDNYHVRRTLSTSGGVTHKDYIYRKGYKIW